MINIREINNKSSLDLFGLSLFMLQANDISTRIINLYSDYVKNAYYDLQEQITIIEFNNAKVKADSKKGKIDLYEQIRDFANTNSNLDCFIDSNNNLVIEFGSNSHKQGYSFSNFLLHNKLVMPNKYAN